MLLSGRTVYRSFNAFFWREINYQTFFGGVLINVNVFFFRTKAQNTFISFCDFPEPFQVPTNTQVVCSTYLGKVPINILYVHTGYRSIVHVRRQNRHPPRYHLRNGNE